MQTLSFVRTLMRISGIVTTFDENIVGKLIVLLRLLLFLTGPMFTIVSTFAYVFVHLNDMQVIISTTYIIVGSAISALLHISLYSQLGKIRQLLTQTHFLVNESEYLFFFQI